MYCRHCGNKLPDDSRFCAYCGKSVAVEGVASATDGVAAPGEQGRADKRGRADVDGPADGVAASGDSASADGGTSTAGDAPSDDGAPTGATATEGSPADGGGGSASFAPPVSGASDHADSAKAAPPSDPAPAPAAPSVPDHRTASPRRWMPVAIAAAVVAVIAIAIGLFASQRIEAERIAQEERLELEARRKRLSTAHDVRIAVAAEGWDTDDGGTPLPLEIDGMTEAGDSFEEIQFVDSDGDGISLVPGAYEISVAASPLADYGRMYDYPTDSYTVEVDDGLDAGESVDLSDEIEIELTYPHGLTADGIELAREIALDAGYAEADELADKAYDRYFDDDGEGQSDSSSSGLSGAFGLSDSHGGSADTESRTYDGDFFEIELPTAWEMDVATGGGDVLARHFVKLEGETILTIDVMHGDESVSGTITDAGGREKLGVTSDGHAVIATRGNGNVAYNSMELVAQTLQTIDID